MSQRAKIRSFGRPADRMPNAAPGAVADIPLLGLMAGKLGSHSTLRVAVSASAWNPVNPPFYRLDSRQRLHRKLSELHNAPRCVGYTPCRSMACDLGRGTRR
jgi:hypothetical protein